MRFESDRSPRSWRTYLSLTLASALLAHLAFDVADAGWLAITERPVHIIYLVIVGVMLAGAGLELYHPRAAERRRRAALMRSRLRKGQPLPTIAGIAAQGLVAGSTLALEAPNIDLDHIVVAVVSGLVAIIVGALVLRDVEGSVYDAIVAIFAPRQPHVTPTRTADLRPPIAAAADCVYSLFRPMRPPPSVPFLTTSHFRKGHFGVFHSMRRAVGARSSPHLLPRCRYA